MVATTEPGHNDHSSRLGEATEQGWELYQD
jgi:hypothetical protein